VGEQKAIGTLKNKRENEQGKRKGMEKRTRKKETKQIVLQE